MKYFPNADVFRIEGVSQEDWLQLMETASLFNHGEVRNDRREWIETWLEPAPESCSIEMDREAIRASIQAESIPEIICAIREAIRVEEAKAA